VLPPSVPSIPSFPSGLPVAAYFFCLVIPSLTPCPVPVLQYRVLLSFRLSSSCLLLLPRLPFTYTLPSTFPSVPCPTFLQATQ
jgi:hypothetical protein